MLRAGFLLMLLEPGLSAAASAADEGYLHELIAQAHAQDLAASRQWRALLHYRDNLIFPGVTGQADDPDFYLSPAGKTRPQVELDATLGAFFAPPIIETDTAQHPQCRFIARYQWLRETLHFDPQRLPPQPCERFRAWRAALNASALTLVFPSAYINNPSSMFGHTLLRVDAADQDERTRLLAYAINYAVGPNGDDPVVFTFKSLIGAYPGLFSISPYYVKVKEYSDMESRDIWEYRLNFTQEEIDRMLMHAWELGPARFDYYFFDENCAYHLLSLFEVARPELRLTGSYHGWVIPVDTVRRLAEEPGMVAEVVYRPASNTRLRDRLARLTLQERDAMQRLLQPEPVEDALRDLPVERQATVLEGAYALVRYESSAGLRGQAEAAQLSRSLLLARSRMPVAEDSPEPPIPAVRPDQGHKTRRLALGLGHQDGRDYQVLSLRPAYHDLLDEDGGYTQGAQINFLDVTLRHYQDEAGVELESLALVDIYSLAPRDAFIRPVSWKINTGLARTYRGEGDRIAVYRTNGGAGLAAGSWEGTVVYGFLEGSLDLGGGLEHDYALGLGPSVGVLARPLDNWKLNLFARVQAYHAGDKHTTREVTLEQNVSLGRQHALRLTLTDRREDHVTWTGAAVAWQWYF